MSDDELEERRRHFLAGASPCASRSIFILYFLNLAAVLSTLPGHPNLTVLLSYITHVYKIQSLVFVFLSAQREHV